ncbi:MAG TPA: Sir2 family NAD-dependent protein deacetylase [Dermatophilaceae bacterium]|nr:Sir2 family NAD-dependent protein deacetylase [Dermatophilaceae bacterium]
MSREAVHRRLVAANPGFDASGGQVQPDGDVVLGEAVVREFRPPTCPVCGSDRVKPDVVYFGESVPKPRVEAAFALVDAATSLVVLGSSLQVMSGYRFVRRMAALRRPVAIVTHGWSRGDHEATVRLDAPLGATLTELVARVVG